VADPQGLEERLAALDSKVDQTLFWLRLLALDRLRERVERLVKTDRDKLIYELTDGQHSTTEISKAAGISQPAVSNIWIRWRAEGIVAEVPEVKGRCKHVAGLAELGISGAGQQP
jgi:DNA-binding transcriptional ArsR family regulator